MKTIFLLALILGIGSLAQGQITFSLTGEASSSTISFNWSSGNTFTTADSSSLLSTDGSLAGIGTTGDWTSNPSAGIVLDLQTTLLANNSIDYIGDDSQFHSGYFLRLSSNIQTTVGGSSIDLIGIFLDSDDNSRAANLWGDFGLAFDTNQIFSSGTPIVFPSTSGSATFELPGSDTFSLFSIGSDTLNEDFNGVPISVSTSAVPEPSTYAAIAFGVLGLIVAFRRK